MEIRVTKLTDEVLLHKANKMTTGKESRMSLRTCYKTGHSNQRTQIFWVEFSNIPSFVVGHLVRHIHAQPFVQSLRTDRGGLDFTKDCEDMVTKIEACAYGQENDAPEYMLERATDTLEDVSTFIKEAPEKYGRMAPQSMGLLLNAEEIINISKLRLCNKASKETRDVWQEVKEQVAKVDPDLAFMMVPQCIYRGGICPEMKSCRFCESERGKKILSDYKELFEK